MSSKWANSHRRVLDRSCACAVQGEVGAKVRLLATALGPEPMKKQATRGLLFLLGWMLLCVYNRHASFPPHTHTLVLLEGRIDEVAVQVEEKDVVVLLFLGRWLAQCITTLAFRPPPKERVNEWTNTTSNEISHRVS